MTLLIPKETAGVGGVKERERDVLTLATSVSDQKIDLIKTNLKAKLNFQQTDLNNLREGFKQISIRGGGVRKF